MEENREICERCQSGFELLRGGVVVNPLWKGRDEDGKRIHEIEFFSGLLSNQIYYIDMGSSTSVCHSCLTKDVESGNGIKKDAVTCHKCKTVYTDANGWDGDTISEDGSVLLWYGSRYDEELHLFPNLQVKQWHCYVCLDKEVDEGNSRKVRASPVHKPSSETMALLRRLDKEVDEGNSRKV